MTIEDIKAQRDQAPFQPFVIHLTNGSALPVAGHDFLSINPERDDIFILWVGRSWSFIAVDQVAKLSGVSTTSQWD